MSEYTTESPASLERRQRRRRAVITIGTLLLGLFFAFWYGLSYYEADKQAQASEPTAPTCRPYDPDEITPADVTVNVYNATSRNGLAGRTAKSIEERGFTVKKVANDPSSRSTPKVAEVRSGEKGKKYRDIVLASLPEGTKTATDKRKDASLDVVLGTEFKNLAPVPTSTQLPMCPAPSASASPSPSS